MSVTFPEITDQERTVWLAVCEGRTSLYIAHILKLGRTAVENRRISLCRKLGLPPGDVPGLVRRAADSGLLATLPPLEFRPERHIRPHR